MVQQAGYPELYPKYVLQVPERGLEITRVGTAVFKRWITTKQGVAVVDAPRTGLTLRWTRVLENVRGGRPTTRYIEFMQMLDRYEVQEEHRLETGVGSLSEGAL